MITPLLVSLLVVALVAYLAERGMPQYTHAIRIVALLLVLLLLLRWGGLF
jgi:hypothetical protein